MCMPGKCIDGINGSEVMALPPLEGFVRDVLVRVRMPMPLTRRHN